MTRRDVWVDHMDDGRYQVRWHGGEWRDRDGSYRTTDKKVVWRILQGLIRQDGGEGWKRVDGLSAGKPSPPTTS
jgi:hypothetical protein